MTAAHRLRAAVVFIALCAGQVPAASAQTPDAEPRSTSLFGLTASHLGVHPRSLDVSLSISSAHDDDLSGAQGLSTSPLQPRTGGQYSDLDAFVSLVETRPRFRIATRAAGSLRRYHDLNYFLGSSASAGAVLTANVTRETTVRTSLDVNYVSSFAFDTFARRLLDQANLSTRDPGQLSPSKLESGSLDWTTTSSGGAADVTRTLGRRAMLRFTYGVRHSEGLILREYTDDRTAAAEFGRSVGRDTFVRVEHTFRQGAQSFGGRRSPVWGHDVQFGIERQWRHSRFRRTSVSLTAGPSVFRRPSVPEAGDGVQRLPIVGTMILNHEMNRSWSARLSYRRGAGVRDARILSNTGTADLRGQMGRRLDVTLSAGYFDRDLGLEMRATRYGTWFGSARLQVAITRYFATYGQYFLDHYDYGTHTDSPAESLRQLERRGFRFGVTLWAPLRRRLAP